MRELADVRLTHLHFDLKAFEELTKARIALGDFRLDNQSISAKFPIVV